MQQNKYVEALDTLISHYYGKIAELEKMKLEFLSESDDLEELYEDTKRTDRKVVAEVEQYDIMRGVTVRRAKYDDGTYEEIVID